jgi:hypothetical protein
MAMSGFLTTNSQPTAQSINHTSDVAHIIALIDQEIVSMNNAKRFAQVARHRAISRGYNRIGYHLASLPPEVTGQQAASIFFERCEQLVL